MESTSINLLTLDGGISATFTPELTVRQYSELARAIEDGGQTSEAMSELLKSLADLWGCKVIIDPC